MRFRLLFFGLLAALWSFSLSGCTSDSSNGGNSGSSTPPDTTTGTVKVFLADPGTDNAQAQVRKTLSFFGIDDDDRVTFDPVTLDYNAVQTLSSVPVSTRFLVITDPNDPSVIGTEQVDVVAGKTTYVNDVVLFPARTAPLVALGRQGKFDGSPVKVGLGFVQTKPSTIGDPGANNGMAGALATSATDDLPLPYKTNSWLSPMLYADNHSTVFTGGSSTPGQYNPDGNPKVLYQLPVYPHPWTLYYNTSDHPATGTATAPVVPGFASIKGLKLQAEIPIFAAGTQIPSPQGPPSSTTYGEFNTTYPANSDMITLDPGFLATRIKVARMGDYDADLVLRASDATNFDDTGLPEDALLKLGVVRGNPLLYFTAQDLPKVDLYHTLTPTGGGTLSHTEGTLTIGGTAIGYVLWTGLYGTGDVAQTRSTVLFFPQAAASYAQEAAIQNSGEGGTGFFSVKTTLTFTNASASNFFAIANLPDATFGDEATLTKLAQAAFSFPTNSLVTYSYNAQSQTVDEVYNLQTSNVLGLPNQAISGLMPHHYQPSPVHNNDPILQGSPSPLTNGGGSVMSFLLTQGQLHVYDTNTWTCRYPVPGLLPFMPDFDAADNAGRTELKDWIQNQLVGKWSGAIPPYTNLNAVKGSQSYQIAKFVQRNMLALPGIDMVGDTALSSQILSETKNAMEIYFRQTPTQTAQEPGSAPYYTYYDPLVGSLFQYPQAQPPANPNFPSDTNTAPHEAFGATSRCNDHQFHYGYFIHTAAQIAIRDPQWGNDWRDAINQYVFDAANTDEINPNPIFPFPKLRYWDAYMNHGYSAGLTWPDLYGNNEESVSEELNFWAGTALWGAATNQQPIMEHGLEHFACEVHSSYMYWFDISGNKLQLATDVKNAKINWPGSGGSLLTDAHTGFNTFFNAHPAASRVIIVLPISPASFYLAMNPTFTAQSVADYRKFIADFNIDPLKPAVGQDKNGGPFSINNPWLFSMIYCSQLAKWMAMVDPANALTTFYNPPNNRTPLENSPNDITIPVDMVTDEGDSAVITFHMVHYMQQHGTPDLWRKSTTTPFAMVFEDTVGKKRTYVGFNSTGSPLSISFADGTVLNNVPARKLGTLEVAVP